MHHALILSTHHDRAAGRGPADILRGFGMAVREAAWPAAAPFADVDHAVVIIELSVGEAAPDADQLSRAGLAGAIVLTCGAAPAGAPSVRRHLSDPADEGAMAVALTGAGYAAPIPDKAALAQQLGALVDDDPSVVTELVASLLDTNQSDLRDFRQACAARRWPDARACAHRIKGTAHMVGAPALVALSQRIELLAQHEQGDTVAALASLYVPAVQRLSQTLAALVG